MGDTAVDTTDTARGQLTPSQLLMPMPGATTAAVTAMAAMVLDTAVDTTDTARGPLMPMPGATDTAVPTDTMAVMADTATGTARGPLMSRRRPRSPPDPTLT